jgi:hypothetical protein
VTRAQHIAHKTVQSCERIALSRLWAGPRNPSQANRGLFAGGSATSDSLSASTLTWSVGGVSATSRPSEGIKGTESIEPGVSKVVSGRNLGF